MKKDTSNAHSYAPRRFSPHSGKTKKQREREINSAIRMRCRAKCEAIARNGRLTSERLKAVGLNYIAAFRGVPITHDDWLSLASKSTAHVNFVDAPVKGAKDKPERAKQFGNLVREADQLGDLRETFGQRMTPIERSDWAQSLPAGAPLGV